MSNRPRLLCTGIGCTEKALTYAAQCGTEPECKVSVQAGCDDAFDLRSSNVPCEKLVPDQKWVTAAFVEKDSVVLRASYGAATACIATIQDEIRCWGIEEIENNVPVAVNLTALKMSDGSACIKDDIGLKCWGPNAYYLANVPPLSNPTRIAPAKYSNNMCVIDDVGLHCWGDLANPAQSAPLGSETTIELPDFRCEVTAEVFECNYVNPLYSETE